MSDLLSETNKIKDEIQEVIIKNTEYKFDRSATIDSIAYMMKELMSDKDISKLCLWMVDYLSKKHGRANRRRNKQGR